MVTIRVKEHNWLLCDQRVFEWKSLVLDQQKSWSSANDQYLNELIDNPRELLFKTSISMILEKSQTKNENCSLSSLKIVFLEKLGLQL